MGGKNGGGERFNRVQVDKFSIQISAWLHRLWNNDIWSFLVRNNLTVNDIVDLAYFNNNNNNNNNN